MKVNILELNSKKIFSFPNYIIPFKAGIKCKFGKHVGYILNHEYGRCLYLGKEKTTNFNLFVKGTGWNIGNVNYKQANWGIEFYLGLLEKNPGGIREWHTSNYYQKFFWATKVIAVNELKQIADDYGNFLDAQTVKYSNGSPFKPVNVFFISRSKYRISDWKFLTTEERKVFIKKAYVFLNSKSKKEYLQRIMDLIIINVALHHKLGGVNDTLGSQNFTLYGEITDFEDIYSPNLPFTEQSWNENIFMRQEKEINFALVMLFEFYSYFLKPDYQQIRKYFFNFYEKIVCNSDNYFLIHYLEKNNIPFRI